MKTAPKRWTNRDLREIFDLYNSRYFRNSLPHIRLAFSDMPNGLGRTTRLRYASGQLTGEYAIYIAKELRSSRRLWASTLLHEMVHLKQKNRYSCGRGGYHFNREMKRLARLGAFNGLW